MLKYIAAAAAVVGLVVVFNRAQGDGSFGLRWSTKQRIGGGLDQVTGNVKQGAGQLVGNDSLTAEGLVDETVGKVRSGLGKAVDVAQDAARDAFGS